MAQATSFNERLVGLLRPLTEDAEFIFIEPCSSIHTFFMRHPIDVVFLDGSGGVLRVCHNVQPWRCRSQRGASAVLEFDSKLTLSRRICVGDQIRLSDECCPHA